MTEEGRDARVLVIVPVLRRPHRVEPLLASLAAATPEPHRVIFAATSGDEDEISAIRSAGADWIEVQYEQRGDYARKVNRVYAVTDEPFLFTGADDLDFHPGWCAAALAAMADSTIGVVGTQDLAPTKRARAGEHSTHFLIRRTYVDRFGTIDHPGRVFHEGYPHEYVDDELVGTAKHRGAWAFAHDSIVEHLHPSWGKAPSDPLYAAQRSRMLRGQQVYLRRRKLWK